MFNACFLGLNKQLEQAFPPDLRSEIQSQCQTLGVDIGPDAWKEHRMDLAKTDVIFSTWGMPALDEEFLESAPRLKAVFYAAGSVKGFAKDAAYDRGIVISSAWAANAVPVSEYALSVILLSLKRFWAYARITREERRSGHFLTVPGAYRSKVGLVSLGAIGKLVARRLGGYEVDLIAHDPFADPETAHELRVTLLSLEEIFSTSDVVSLHTPWLPETVGLINGRLLRTMKEGATLINTSRGAVVNEADLVEVLLERPDLTAILDVTWPEPPPPDSAFYSLPNVILTPHIAGSMDGEIARMGRWMTDEFFRFQQGKPLKHTVSRSMLARMA